MPRYCYPAKVVSVEDRNKEATKLAQKGFISRAVNLINSFEIAPCTMKVIQQMPGKHSSDPKSLVGGASTASRCLGQH